MTARKQGSWTENHPQSPEGLVVLAEPPDAPEGDPDADAHDHQNFSSPTTGCLPHPLPALAGAMVMGEFAWAMESLLNQVREGKIEAAPSMFKLLEQAEVTLNKLLMNLKGESDQRPPVKRLQDIANAFAEGKDFSVSEVLPDVASSISADTVTGTADTEPEQSTEPKPETEEAFFDPVLAQVFRKETVTHLAALNEYLSE